ncbi:MAG: glycerophosphodiester phosphodiesterase family protein [Phycisphaerales bacterium]|nr:glycerophosphodiester phosphodiesterase family protein [Hyphomonadaceae bacterium]
MKRALMAAALVLAACGDIASNREPGSADGPWNGAPELTPHFPPPTNLPAFFDCVRASGGAIVSAHRGGPARGYAENAVATFERTLSQAPAFLEVDVNQTRDGALVLMHDDTVDRTTEGAGALSAMTLQAFQALRLQDEDGTTLDQHPPTLRQALDWADGRAILELDIKRSVSYEDAVREVEEAGAMDRVVFITYNIDGAARLARLAPGAMIYTTISGARDLDVLERRRVNLNHIVAWLGTEAPDARLVEALAARGVEARFGMFGEGGDFANAARVGAQIVAVDDAAEAARDLDAADGEEGYAALRCAS